jgi:hypothetical protein
MVAAMPGAQIIGRDSELAQLDAALADALAGRGSVFLLSGEPGIGKTRLAEELSARAAARGAGVHWGRAWESEGAPVAWPWVQILRSFARRPGGDALLRSEQTKDLALLLPELGAAPGSYDAEQAHFRLAWALTALLDALTAEQPQVLVFDDLHAVDATSLALLQAVARESLRLRLLIIGTYRDVEARSTPELGAALARLSRSGRAQPLGRLGADAVTQLMEASLQTPVPAAVAQSVFKATEGNPLFVDAVGRLLASRGQLAALPAHWPLPDTVRETLLQRFELLTPPTRALLDAASVLGREVPRTVLQEASGAAAGDVLAALDEGAAKGVLEAGAPQAPALRFAHVLYRDALYQALSAKRRVELHAACGAALEKIHRHELDARSAELAHHFMQAAPVLSWAKAREYSARAGERSMELLAFSDAVAHFSRALEALDAQTDADPLPRAELLWRLGEAQVRSGALKAGRESCQRSAALAKQHHAPKLVARAALTMGAELTAGQPNPELARVLEDALAALGDDEPGLKAQLRARAAAAQVPSIDMPRLCAMAKQAIAEARAVGDPRVLAQVLSTARSVFTPRDDLHDRIALDSELAGLARTLGARHLKLQAHERLVLDAAEQGDDAGVAAHLDACEQLGQELGSPNYQWRTPLLRMMWATVQGRVADSERHEQTARALIAQLESRRGLVAVECLKLLRAHLSGSVEEEQRALATVDVVLGGDAGAAVWGPLFRSLLTVRRGDFRELQALVSAGRPPFPMLALAGTGLAILGEVWAATGERERLEELYPLLLPYADRFVIATAIMLCTGPAAYPLGLVAAALGKKAEARAHLEAAIALATRAGAEPYRQLSAEALRRLDGERPAPARATAPAAPPALTREGELWSIVWAGETAKLKHSKGLVFLAELIRQAGRELHVTELIALEAAGDADAPDVGLSAGDAGELLDAKARAAYQVRLEELEDTLREAESFGDRARAAKARAEREAIADELARAVGLGGRSRKAASATERARINVQRRLRDVIGRIREQSPALGGHLEAFVRTGLYCSYRPI